MKNSKKKLLKIKLRIPLNNSKIVFTMQIKPMKVTKVYLKF